MKKDRATAILKRQLTRIDDLRGLQGRTSSPEHMKWSRDTDAALRKIFGETSTEVCHFANVSYSAGVAGGFASEELVQEDYENGLTEAGVLLQSLIDEIEEYWESEPAEPPRPALAAVERLCRRFHLVARQLESRHDNRPTLVVRDEYDAQDLLHALLRVEFDDIRPEEWTPSYAGGAARMDFLIKGCSIVVELKKTRQGLGPRDLGDQLIIDIQRYQKHQECETLVCFIYDPELRLANPEGIVRDLTSEGNGLKVVAIVSPTGA